MYSKYKGITDRDYSLTPPPGYDGSRFRRRSDGRDDAFPMYGSDVERPMPQRQKDQVSCRTATHDYSKDEPLSQSPEECTEQDSTDKSAECFTEEETCCTQCAECDSPCHKDMGPSSAKSSKVMSFLHGLGNEEILLISLILLLAGGRNRAETDTILILALLLCVT